MGEEELDGIETLSISAEPGLTRCTAVLGFDIRRIREGGGRYPSVGGGRRSKMCKVPLSEVDAMNWLLGDMARPNMTAASTPRRNSWISVCVLVLKTRIRVPYMYQ